MHILLHSLQKQRCGKVGINSVILGNCGKKSEWKLVQNAAGDLALCPSYHGRWTLLYTSLYTSDCNFLANLGFTSPRVSPIFLPRLHETTRPGLVFLIIPFVFQCGNFTNSRIAMHLKTNIVRRYGFYDFKCLKD